MFELVFKYWLIISFALASKIFMVASMASLLVAEKYPYAPIVCGSMWALTLGVTMFLGFKEVFAIKRKMEADG
jgi:hypothetical protein